MYRAAKICDFVPAGAYGACMEKLEESRIVLVQGHPGSGKTITSIMAALDFANRGYKVRCSADIEKQLREIFCEKAARCKTSPIKLELSGYYQA